jgi:Na+/H+ antiporter NhaD/arsenite permease-like protein
MAATQASQLVAVGIFLAMLATILADWIDRTIAAWVGAMAMVAAGLAMNFYTQHQALAAVDFNTLGLLLGMMMLMSMLKETGLFEALAVLAAQHSRGDPWRLLVLLGGLTAAVSTVLNNVTVIILIAPVTLSVTAVLKLNPVPFLVAEVLLSNLGGTATLIGDPPNTIIASAAGFSFNAFLAVLLPIVVIAYYPTLWCLRRAFTETWHMPSGVSALEELRPGTLIKNWSSLRKLLAVLTVVILLFTVQELIALQPAYIAFIGVALAMILVPSNPGRMLQEVEWSILLFFACLFVAVGGLESAGVMAVLARSLAEFAGSHLLISAVLLIWIGAVLSGVVDNIPFTIAMVPVIKGLETNGVSVEPLWWALALGVGFGGNATPIGASANLVAVAMSERAGYPITVRTWVRSASLATIVSCAVGTVGFLVIFGVLKR